MSALSRDDVAFQSAESARLSASATSFSLARFAVARSSPRAAKCSLRRFANVARAVRSRPHSSPSVLRSMRMSRQVVAISRSRSPAAFQCVLCASCSASSASARLRSTAWAARAAFAAFSSSAFASTASRIAASWRSSASMSPTMLAVGSDSRSRLALDRVCAASDLPAAKRVSRRPTSVARSA